MRRIALLGSTGSIGRQTLEVVRRNQDRLKVSALAARESVHALAEQVAEFAPRLVVVASNEAARGLAERLDTHPGIQVRPEIAVGPRALVHAARLPEVDLVVGALVGSAGIESSLAAVEAGKALALANKETLVAAGPLVTGAARRSGAEIVPIDSEHSAIYQCLLGATPETVARIQLTASGGPFLGWPEDALGAVKPEQALRHPRWRMGPKVTIDSATLMNKGLELIEAHWLFGVGPDRLEVLVHPESIVHSLVEFVDGSVLAQLGLPDMRLPIQVALSAPERWPADWPRLDLTALSGLHFKRPEGWQARSIELALGALSTGGTAGAVLNGANEVAVGAFLAGRIRFADIVALVAAALEAISVTGADDLAVVLEADARARAWVEEKLARRGHRG